MSLRLLPRSLRMAAAGLLLVAAGLALSPSAVPVYDGIGSPDEPYRYVGTSAAPRTVTATAQVVAGRVASLQLKTPEQGPQVLLDLGPDAFDSDGTALTVSAIPMEGHGQQVPQGTIDGNMYRFTVTPGASLAAQRAQGFLFLRAGVMTAPDPVIVHRNAPTDPWAQAKTVRAGQDILSTPFRALGDYAVVRLPGATDVAQLGGGLDTPKVLVLIGGVLVLLVITVVVLRRKPAAGDE